MRALRQSLFEKAQLPRAGKSHTQAFVLKPASIVTAAEADLALRAGQRNRSYDDHRAQPYRFHRAHVARANCSLDLIDRAIKDRYSGVFSGKRITRIIYGDEELLWAARALLSIEATA